MQASEWPQAAKLAVQYNLDADDVHRCVFLCFLHQSLFAIQSDSSNVRGNQAQAHTACTHLFMHLCTHNMQHRARWLCQPISAASISDSLSVIANKQWVAEEVAVGRAAPSEDAQRQLLAFGLSLTETMCTQQVILVLMCL